jgi:hypothetical protein
LNGFVDFSKYRIELTSKSTKSIEMTEVLLSMYLDMREQLAEKRDIYGLKMQGFSI